MENELVAFVGLGAMGQGMVARLAEFLRGGKAPSFSAPLLVNNRTTATAHRFAAEQAGVAVAESVAELSKANIVFSMLANDAAADTVLDEYLAGLKGVSRQEKPVYVNCATVLPTTVTRQAAAADAAGVLYLNMPVFGRPDAAAAGSLIAVPAGPSAARERVKPLLPAFAGRAVWDLGEDPAASAALKLIGNFWIVSQIEVASQCLVLGGKNGVTDDAMLRMLETFLVSPIPLGYVKRISAGDYSTETGFAVDLALKDVGHMKTLAAQSTCPLPLADMAFNHLLQAKATHGGQLDWGAIHLAVRQAAGLPSNSMDKQV